MFNIVVTDMRESSNGCGVDHDVNHGVGPFLSHADAEAFLAREGFVSGVDEDGYGTWKRGAQSVCVGNQEEDCWSMPLHEAYIVEMRSPSESFRPVMLRWEWPGPRRPSRFSGRW